MWTQFKQALGLPSRWETEEISLAMPHLRHHWQRRMGRWKWGRNVQSGRGNLEGRIE
jgi:hypothetical protein